MNRGATMKAKTSATIRWAALVAAVATSTFGLGGCVTVFPKSKPIQLYTFGHLRPDQLSQGQASPQPGGVGVVLAPITMPTAAVGDQILTLTGQQAAYIAGARWVVPAGLQMQADAERAFEAESRQVRLLHRGDLGGAGALLHLDVGDFEARYDTPGAAPTVVVSLRATLTRSGGLLIAERTFTVRQLAEENRISAIAAAFDKAVIDVLGQVVAWTDASSPAPATTTGQGR